MKIEVTYVPSTWSEQLAKLKWSDRISLVVVPF